MSVRAYYDTWCDGPGMDGEGCLAWADAATGHSARYARSLARRVGWKYDRRTKRDLCPACQALASAVSADQAGGAAK